MRKHRVKALSISRPVFDRINGERLIGRVLANHGRACNLAISEREIVALVGPAIGNGPLNIVIEETGVLKQVKPGSPAVFSAPQLLLGDSLLVLLDGARLWNPEVDWECLATRQRDVGRNLAALCDWLSRAEGLASDFARGVLSLVLKQKRLAMREDGIRLEVETASPQERAFLTTARAGIEGLMQSLQDGERSGIRESAARLAGLGPGLTPAGDDYLVGLMAGLRLWPALLGHSGLSPHEACSTLLEAAEGRTTFLSRAFLHSAQQGLFGEAWHELLAELARNENESGGEAIGIQRAARRILSSGATSGADALAGFLSPYLYSESQDRWAFEYEKS